AFAERGIDHLVIDAFEIEPGPVPLHLGIKWRFPIVNTIEKPSFWVKKSHDALISATNSSAAIPEIKGLDVLSSALAGMGSTPRPERLSFFDSTPTERPGNVRGAIAHSAACAKATLRPP